MAESGKKDVVLEWVLTIYYLLHFLKDTIDIRTLIDLSNKVNAIILAYATNLSLKIWTTGIRAKKTNSSTFKIFEMILANF